MTRRRVVLAVAALAAVAWCLSPATMTPEGGGWYTTFTSSFPESGGNIRLYRKGSFGTRVLVAERVYIRRFYQPDCLLFDPGEDLGTIYAGCGDRIPVSIATYPVARPRFEFDTDSTGLVRVDTVRVVNGRVLARVERIAIHDIRQLAESQRPLSNWSGRLYQTGAIDPVIRDEPADLRATTPFGSTPLIDAVRHRQLDVLDALILLGADVNQASPIGLTPLDLAMPPFDTDTLIVFRLIDAGARLNANDYIGNTPLIEAALINNPAVFHYMLARGADPCGRNKSGRNIVDYSVQADVKRMAVAAYAKCKD